MAFAAFGPGILIVTRTDLAYPVPINVGYAQELTIDLAGNVKELFGQKQFPLVSARSTIKATGKFKAAMISGLAWNNCFYGQDFTTGSLQWSVGSTASVPASSAYTITVGSSTSYDSDLGVVYSTQNLPLQRVAGGSEEAGKYSVSGNIYTFASADASKAVKITYAASSATGQSLVMTNPDIGDTPTFQLDYYTALNQPTSKPFSARLFACVGSKHSMPFKLEDFMMPEFEFSIFANASDQVLGYYFPEIS